MCRVLTRSKVRCTRCPSSRPPRTRSCTSASALSHGFDSRQESYLSTSTHSVHFSIPLISPILYFVTLFHSSFHLYLHPYSFTLLISPSALTCVHANSYILHTTFFLFLHFSCHLFAAVPTSFSRKPSLHLTHLVSVLSRYTRTCTLLSRARIFISLSIITYPGHTHTQTHSYLASCSLSSILSFPRSLSPRGTVFFCAVRTWLVWCSGTDPRTFWVPTKSSHWYSCLSWKSPSFSLFYVHFPDSKRKCGRER